MRNNATFQEQKKLELEFCSSEFATNLKIIQGGNCQQNFTMVWSTVGEEWQRMNEEEARGSANDKTQKKTQQAWLWPNKTSLSFQFLLSIFCCAIET